MKRIIILSYDFPSNNGGIARLCGEIYNQCHKSRIPVLVITNCRGQKSDDIIRFMGRRGLVDWRMYRCLKRNVRKDDVIIADTYHPGGFIGVFLGYPTYILAHGAEFLPKKSFFRKWVMPVYRKWVLRKANKVIANSRYTKMLVEHCSPNATAYALPLAVDVNLFQPTKSKQEDGLLHLCTISRLEKFKAQDFVIRTIASLPESYKQKIRFEIGGKGIYKPELERMVNELDLQGIVSFRGFISDEELCNFYSENDVFILTTREDCESGKVEGFGLVFAEAQACGTPVVGTRTGGIPDAVHEGNGGWLIEQDDEQQLAALLMKFVDNPEILQLEGQRGLKRIREEYTWEVYFKKLTALISE